MKDHISQKEVVEFLNELLAIDSRAINTLFNIRVLCNKKMADHPTVQVGSIDKSGKVFQVGFVGILNGMFGVDVNGWGHISVDTEDGSIKQFRLLTPEEVNQFIQKK